MSAPLAAYVRVSHVGGRRGDSFRSPDDQAREVREWAKRHGHQVEFLPPELDAKGSDASRPTLRRAVEGVTMGEFSGVVVAYLSRAGRDLRLMLDLWAEVEAVGGAVYSARENIDGSTSSGRLQRNLLASIAQHELEERREGFARSRAGAVERGIWTQRQTPIGYARDVTTRRLTPDERREEVPAAFRDFAAGVPVVDLADRLRMTPGGVRGMLRNRVYLGELRVGREFNPAAHEPLVSLRTWEAAQVGATRPARRERGAPALLAGLVTCGSCGHRMTRGGSRKLAVYACPKQHSGGACPGPAAVTLALLDAYVERIAVAELERLAVTASDGDGVERARRELERAEAELGAYLAAVSPLDVGHDAFHTAARQRQQAANAAREALRSQVAQRPAVSGIANGAEAWVELDGHERNRLLRALLHAVVVHRGGGRGSRTLLADRVRVVAYGADLPLAVKRAEAPAGIVPVPLLDADHPSVLGITGGEDAA